MAGSTKKAGTAKRPTAKKSSSGSRRASTSKKLKVTVVDESQVRQRAYEIFLSRGEQPGNDKEDWLRAEQELQA